MTDWSIAHKSHVGGIGETYPVLWTFQHRDEARGLLKETLLPGDLFGEPSLRHDRGGSLIADNEHAANSIERCGVVDRSVAISPIDVLSPSISRNRDELIFVPRCGPACHDLFNLWSDDLPYFLPNLAGGPPQ
jgi:hypothetical protein